MLETAQQTFARRSGMIKVTSILTQGNCFSKLLKPDNTDSNACASGAVNVLELDAMMSSIPDHDVIAELSL